MSKRVRDYKKEYEWQGTEEQKKRRAQRNKDRRKALREGKVKKGDDKDVHHVDNNPKNHSSKNVKVISRSKNRSMQ
jgi:hypothetical protein